MWLIGSQGTLLCIGCAVAASTFLVQFLLCRSEVRLCIKLVPLYLLGIYVLLILLVLTGFLWDDTNFYISAQQFIAIILAAIGAFAAAGMGIAWVVYRLVHKSHG